MSTEISVIVEQEIEKRWKELISNPENILELWKKDSEEKQKEIERLTPMAQKYSDFLDADGYIDSARVSALIKMEYVTPSGKVAQMGRNHFLSVLNKDGIIISAYGGYRFSSRYENKLGVTLIKPVNDRVTSVCLFTPEGINKLIDKYSNDTRKWYSDSNHQLFWE